MTITIHNETDTPQDDLQDAIQRAIDSTAHRVTDVTGMEMPEQIRIRLVTSTQLNKINRDYFAETIKAANLVSNAIEEDAQKIILKVFPPVIGAFMFFACPLIGGQTIQTDEGSDILMMPKSLERLKVKQKDVDAITAHELTHALQNNHNPGFTRERLVELMQGEKRKLAVSHLSEGHATWSHYRITTELHGEPVVKLGEATKFEMLPYHLRALPVKLVKPKSDYTEGEKFIEHVFGHGGTKLVNRMWMEKALIPTPSHIEHPQSWVEALAQ